MRQPRIPSALTLLVMAGAALPAAAGLLPPAPGDLLSELLARDQALVERTRLAIVLVVALTAIAAVAVAGWVLMRRRLAERERAHLDELDGLGALARELAGGTEPGRLPAVLLRRILLMVPGAARASLVERAADATDYRVVASEGEDAVAVGSVLPGREVGERLAGAGEDLGARVVLLQTSPVGAAPEGRGLAVEAGGGPGRLFLVVDGLDESWPGMAAGHLQTLGELAAAAAVAARRDEELTAERTRVAAANVALERSRGELERLTRTDTLTGLPNRREMLERLTAEWRRIGRYDGSSILLLADLDGFRALNDEHGPECGDFVLVESARLLRKVLRDQDTAGRWGGEEFLVLLPETGVDGGALVAERIRAEMARADLMWRGSLLETTVSVGVVELSALRTPAESIGMVDAAVHLAKRRGRNRVEVARGRQQARPGEAEPAPTAPEAGESTGTG